MLHSVDTWARYVNRIAGHLKQADIADKTGVAQTNVGRWLRGDPGMPRAESVVAFARAFGQPPVEALAAAGYITAREASPDSAARTPLSKYTNAELVAELQNRMTESG